MRRIRSSLSSRVRGIVGEELRAGGYDRLQVAVRNLESQLQDRRWNEFIELYLREVSDHLQAIDGRVGDLKGQVLESEQRLLSLEMTVQHLLSRFEDLLSRFEDLLSRFEDLLSRFEVLSSRLRALPYHDGSLLCVSEQSELQTLGFTRTGESRGLVDIFRPSFDILMSELEYLIDYLPDRGRGVDLGAGRGEMVSLLRAVGVDAYGVDSDPNVVSEAQNRGVDVRLAEIGSFLDSSHPEEYRVVTAIQVIEHVDPKILMDWLRSIAQILQPSGILVLETPNPHAVDAFKAFWVDTTHVRPYYPESLLLMVREAGFDHAEVIVKGNQWSVYDRLEFANSYAVVAIKGRSPDQSKAKESQHA